MVLLAIVVGLPTLGLTSLLGYSAFQEHKALEAHRAETEQMFAPALAALDQGEQTAPEDIDLDKTVRLIHAMDQALQTSDNLPTYLQALARQDWRGVDPRVVEARADLTRVLLEIYANQIEQEDQAAMWDATSSTLALLSVVGGNVGADSSPLMPMSFDGEVEVDRARATELYEQVREDHEEQERLHQELVRLEGELLENLFAYGDVYFEVLQRWDRVCVARDRAWLAAWAQDWEEVLEASDEAIALAPHEREAHLLKAWALVELGRTEEADTLIAEQLALHPEHSAPLLLVRGSSAQARGDLKEARLSFQQAAAAYPLQAEHLTEMADPYEVRSHLRKSREGTFILELYRSTMLGAGSFSPDLHLAALHFDEGDREAGRRKVMDHFSRRRAQAQWDFVLQDIELCLRLLGDDFRSIFPEDAYLDLVVDEAMLGSSLELTVHNRSDRTLHNATLVLCVQLTDMHPDDYLTLVGGETQPAVVAHKATDFGDLEVKVPWMGEDKDVEDVVLVRAILVSNEAVVWVDTDEYKLAETARDEKKGAGEAVSRAVTLAGERTTISVEKGLFADTIEVTLPRELALLHPSFRLDVGGELHAAKSNEIREEGIVVVFETRVGQGDVVMKVGSPYQDLSLTFSPRGEEWGLSTLRRD